MTISRMQQPRQLYGLGSLVKKITRPIKKIVKSPIGKAALGAAALYGVNKFGIPGIGGKGAISKFLLGSRVMNEGITLENVKDVHILDVHYNLGKVDQVIGRAIRMCKHQAVIDDQNKFPEVNVYRYVASIKKGLSSDEVLYQKAELKYLLVKKVERILKTVAVDCPLLLHNNKFPEEIDKYKNKKISTYKFMTFTCKVKKKCIDQAPAVVHIDNTARPQVVDKKSNIFLYKILESYKKKTGCGILINTSFNIHEEPIVFTFGDAIKSLLYSSLDYLVNDEIIIKNKLKK